METQASKQNSIKKSQRVWQTLYVIVSITSTVLFKYLYQDIQNFSSQYIFYGKISHLLWSVPLLLIMHLYHNGIPALVYNWVSKIFRQPNGMSLQKRQKRIKYMSKWCADIPYYLLTSFAAFTIMKNHTQFPSFLGGPNGFPDQIMGCFMCKGIGNLTIEPQNVLVMQTFYLIQFSHHFYGFLKHLVGNSYYGTSKYYQFLFHHLAASILILLSYLMNYWKVGIMVLLFHDISDATLQAGRFYLDTIYKNEKVLNFLYGFILIVWITSRLILFPCCCILFGFYIDYTMSVALMVLLSLETALFVMHIYWTYEILASAFVSRKNY